MVRRRKPKKSRYVELAFAHPAARALHHQRLWIKDTVLCFGEPDGLLRFKSHVRD